MLDGQASALDVINGYRAEVGLVSGAIQEHDGDSTKLELSDPLVNVPDGCEEYPTNPLLHQHQQLRAFAIRFLRAISDLDGVALFIYVILGTNHEIGEKGIGDIHDNHAYGATTASPKLTRRLIRNPTELCNRDLYPASRWLRNQIGRVQNIRNGAQ